MRGAATVQLAFGPAMRPAASLPGYAKIVGMNPDLQGPRIVTPR